MTQPFFQTPERTAVLRAVAESWLGTPFHPHAGTKGVGVDCVSLALSFYREAGLAIGEEPTSDVADVIRVLLGHGFARCDAPFQLGDLLYLCSGDWHTCMVLVDSTTALHVTQTRPVHWQELRWKWRRRVRAIYRP